MHNIQCRCSPDKVAAKCWYALIISAELPLLLSLACAVDVMSGCAGSAGGTPSDCSFFTKVQVAQSSGADAIIVLNERDDSAITMDTSKMNGELTCAPLVI